MRNLKVLAAVVAAFSWAGVSQAAPISDPAGDLLNTFTALTNPDLDVLSAEVTYDTSTGLFVFTSTSAGAIGTTANSSFVWGVNRGAGTAGFAANGITGVFFDRVVRLLPDGTGQIAGGGLPAINLAPGSVTISGSTITGSVPASLLPSTGFSVIGYTFNLWPRTAAPGGFAGISDFAPDNSNFASTVIPEPAGLGLLGVAGLAMSRRRRA